MRSFDRDAAILQNIPGALVRTLSDVDYGRASSALEVVVVEDEQRADRILGAAAMRLRGRSEQNSSVIGTPRTTCGSTTGDR